MVSCSGHITIYCSQQVYLNAGLYDAVLNTPWECTILYYSILYKNAVPSEQRPYRYCYMDALLDTRMLRAILNKSWRQHPTRHQLYSHLPPITITIQVKRTRHAGYCWRSRDELISDVLLWTLTYGRAKAGRPARTYIQQLCEDTGCSPEDLPEAINGREKWRERIRDICTGGMTWWWWWWYLHTAILSIATYAGKQPIIVNIFDSCLWQPTTTHKRWPILYCTLKVYIICYTLYT